MIFRIHLRPVGIRKMSVFSLVRRHLSDSFNVGSSKERVKIYSTKEAALKALRDVPTSAYASKRLVKGAEIYREKRKMVTVVR